MEFHYYYIVQDVLGLLMAFLYSRMIFLSLKLSIKRKITLPTIAISMLYLALMILGVILVVSPWSLQLTLLAIGLIVMSFVLIQKGGRQ